MNSSTATPWHTLKSSHTALLVDMQDSAFFCTLPEVTAETVLIVINGSAPDHPLLKAWSRSRALIQFDWSRFPLHERLKSHDLAFDNVEAVLDALESSGRSPLSFLRRLYGSELIDQAVKQQLTQSMQKCFSVHDAAELLRRMGIDHVEIFPSRALQATLEIVEETLGADWVQNNLLGETAVRTRPHGRLSEMVQRLRSTLRTLAIPAVVISRMRRIRSGDAREKVKALIRVYNTDLGLDERSALRIDWLLDGKCFHKDNVVFLSDVDLSETYRSKLEAKQYRYCDASRTAALRHVSWQFLLRDVLLKSVCVLPALVRACLVTPNILMPLIFEAWIDWFRWRAFTRRYSAGLHVAYNELSIFHVFRNIVLEQAGTATVFFQHTNSTYNLYEAGDLVSGRHASWAYMNYAFEAHWLDQQARIMDRSRCRAIRRKAYGSFWAMNVRADPNIRDDLEKKAQLSRYKNILVGCTTSLWLDAVNGPEEHCAFLEGMLKMIDDDGLEKTLLILKPKKPFDHYLDAEDESLRQVATAVTNHPRIFVAEASDDTGALIGLADLTISMSFASPAVEAILGGRKGLFFDPLGHFPRGHLHRYDNLVATGMQELRDKARFWINDPGAAFSRLRSNMVDQDYALEGGSAIEAFRKDLDTLSAKGLSALGKI